VSDDIKFEARDAYGDLLELEGDDTDVRIRVYRGGDGDYEVAIFSDVQTVKGLLDALTEAYWGLRAGERDRDREKKEAAQA
jgi:hypothetical protein